MIETNTHWDAIEQSFTKQLTKEKEQLLVAHNFVRHFVNCVGEVFSICFLKQHHTVSAYLLENLLKEFTRQATPILADLLFEFNVENVFKVAKGLKLFD